MSAFDRAPGTTIKVGGVEYRVAEHPGAPGVTYAQEGRQGVVFQLLSAQGRAALKVFKVAYQDESLVGRSEALQRYAAIVPGLAVLRRTILNEDSVDRRQLNTHPELWYAVLMPWIEGETWKEIIAQHLAVTADDSRKLASSLARVLRRMQEYRLGHGDLSGDNLLLPGLVLDDRSARADNVQTIQLIDVEQLYAPEVRAIYPSNLIGGSNGYQRWSSQPGVAAEQPEHAETMVSRPPPANSSAWTSEVDRFSGGVLLAEILGWCDAEVRSAAHHDTYFNSCDPSDSPRAGILKAALERHWGPDIGVLFQRVWDSGSTAECPRFLDWDRAIESAAPSVPFAVVAASTRAPEAEPGVEEMGALGTAVAAPASELAPEPHRFEMETVLDADRTESRLASLDASREVRWRRVGYGLAGALGVGLAWFLLANALGTPRAAPSAPQATQAVTGIPTSVGESLLARTPQPTPAPTATTKNLVAMTVGPSPTPGPSERWAAVLAEIDPLWNSNLPVVIQRIDRFRESEPEFAAAREKLYAAYVEHGKQLVAEDAIADGVAEFQHAVNIDPSRPEATDLLAALTPTPEPTATPVPVPVLTKPVVVPTAGPSRSTQPAPTAQPVEPVEAPVAPTKGPPRL